VAGLIVLAQPIYADRAADIRASLSDVATALSAGDPEAAMAPFDKSFADYATLSGFFQALTKAFQVASEVDVLEEEDNETETIVSTDWTLTLTDLGTDATVRRNATVKLRLQRKDGKWKIVDLAPVEFFSPQEKPARKQ
jgi:ketosteroid isomerase-like protein